VGARGLEGASRAKAGNGTLGGSGNKVLSVKDSCDMLETLGRTVVGLTNLESRAAPQVLVPSQNGSTPEPLALYGSYSDVHPPTNPKRAHRQWSKLDDYNR